MKTFELWEIKNKEGKYLYSNRYSDGNFYMFYTEQKDIISAIKKVKEIFKNKYNIYEFLDEKNDGEEYNFTIIQNGIKRCFELFSLI